HRVAHRPFADGAPSACRRRRQRALARRGVGGLEAHRHPQRAQQVKQAAAQAAYSLLMRLLMPLLLLRLLLRARAEPIYRQSLGERLGLYHGAAPQPGWVWLHAVSLGET